MRDQTLANDSTLANRGRTNPQMRIEGLNETSNRQAKRLIRDVPQSYGDVSKVIQMECRRAYSSLSALVSSPGAWNGCSRLALKLRRVKIRCVSCSDRISGSGGISSTAALGRESGRKMGRGGFFGRYGEENRGGVVGRERQKVQDVRCSHLMRSNALERATSGLDQLMEITGLSKCFPYSTRQRKCLPKPYFEPLKRDSAEEGPLRGRLMKLVMVWPTFRHWPR